jgi:hypothetical protein
MINQRPLDNRPEEWIHSEEGETSEVSSYAQELGDELYDESNLMVVDELALLEAERRLNPDPDDLSCCDIF